jgi:hypothetical protein
LRLPHYRNWNNQNDEISNPVEGGNGDKGTDTIPTYAIDGDVIERTEGPANQEDLQYISDDPEKHYDYTYICSQTDLLVDGKQPKVEKQDA